MRLIGTIETNNFHDDRLIVTANEHGLLSYQLNDCDAVANRFITNSLPASVAQGGGSNAEVMQRVVLCARYALSNPRVYVEPEPATIAPKTSCSVPMFNEYLTDVPVPESWTDVSWGNDSAPSFLVERYGEKWLKVWIDHPDPAKRVAGERFALVLIDDEEPDEPEDLFETDNFGELISAIADYDLETQSWKGRR